MASTNFVPHITPIASTWANAINNFFYNTCGGATSAADLRTNIGAVSNSGDTLTGLYTFTTSPVVPTVAGTTDDTTKVASTAFVQAVAATKVSANNPTLTGTVTIPTVAGSTDNTTKAASTAFVQAVGASIVVGAGGVPAIGGTMTGTLFAENIEPAAVTSLHVPKWIRKTTASTSIALTPLTTDPELTYTAQAGAIYELDILLGFYCAVNTVGFRCIPIYPSDSIQTGSVTIYDATTDIVDGFNWFDYAFVSAFPYNTVEVNTTNAPPSFLRLQGMLETPTGGTIGVSFSQRSLNAAPLNLSANSYMKITRLA